MATTCGLVRHFLWNQNYCLIYGVNKSPWMTVNTLFLVETFSIRLLLKDSSLDATLNLYRWSGRRTGTARFLSPFRFCCFLFLIFWNWKVLWGCNLKIFLHILCVTFWSKHLLMYLLLLPRKLLLCEKPLQVASNFYLLKVISCLYGHVIYHWKASFELLKSDMSKKLY